MPDSDQPLVKLACRNVSKVFGTGAAGWFSDGATPDFTAMEAEGLIAAVRDVTLDVVAGEIFIIMGLSGSGKSTLVRHINRLIEPTHGEILINGTNVGALGAEDLRILRADKIGMVFQDMALLPHRSVRDNVAFALELRNVDAFTRANVAAEVIEQVGLSGYGDRMPSELSGGMQQRVGLARAMAADPDILLMASPSRHSIR